MARPSWIDASDEVQDGARVQAAYAQTLDQEQRGEAEDREHRDLLTAFRMQLHLTG